MNNHISKIKEYLEIIREKLKEDIRFGKDIDFDFPFILPYSKADNISDIKLVIVGQDPTIQCENEKYKKRQGEIVSTLDLNNEKGNLRAYCERICKEFDFDIGKNIYATNLCKCVFKEKPAYNGVLDKHSEHWIPLLKEELSVFSDKVIFITLGQPLKKNKKHTN